ncbi:MAG: alpha/beta hydrolase [Lewinellaceae bacterium]|nr:alpha/beta hydrolase [Lewinellaceae bacterium]
MQELNWTNAEGIHLCAAHWPVKKPRAVLTLVHGQGEHVGRYAHLARWYNTQDVAVVGYDQQGYGRSAGARGHAKNLDVLLDDIGQALDETRSRYSDVSHFLYGHSMGGNLVLNYLLRRKPNLSGVIATAPWVRLAFPAPLLKVFAGRVLSRFTPSLRLPNGLAVHLLSRDRAVVEAYQNDPLVHNQLSVAAGIHLLDAAIWLNHFAGVSPLPLLLQHGSADRITSAPATRELAGRLGGSVAYREWPGLFHEIHNEPEQEQVFQFTLGWMAANARLPSTAESSVSA